MPDTIAVIGSKNPTAEMAAACKELCRTLVAQGHRLVTGNADGIDSLAASIWNELAPEKVTLVLPWLGFNRSKIRPGNRIIVFSNQPEWAESVYCYHPAPDRLSRGMFKLHARNYGIISLADRVFAFPLRPGGGGTGQGIRIAVGLGKPLLVWPDIQLPG